MIKKTKTEDRRRPQIQTTSYGNSIEKNDPPANLASVIRARFAPLGGVELEIPPREPMRDPPNFE